MARFYKEKAFIFGASIVLIVFGWFNYCSYLDSDSPHSSHATHMIFRSRFMFGMATSNLTMFYGPVSWRLLQLWAFWDS